MRSNLAEAGMTAEGGALELVSTSPDREFELIRQAAAGNSHAFRELYNNNVKRVYAVCLRACQDRDTADELTQEVLLKRGKNFHRSILKASSLHGFTQLR